MILSLSGKMENKQKTSNEAHLEPLNNENNN